MGKEEGSRIKIWDLGLKIWNFGVGFQGMKVLSLQCIFKEACFFPKMAKTCKPLMILITHSYMGHASLIRVT